MVCVVYDVTNEDTITKVFPRCLFYSPLLCKRFWRLHVLNVLSDFPDQNKMDTFSEWRCREGEQVCVSS